MSCTQAVERLERAALEERAAAWIASRLLRDAAHGPVVFGACGGRSVEGIFHRLAARTDLPWSAVHVFMVDERVVPADHVDSNFRLLRESLLDPLVAQGRVPPANVHPFEFGTLPDAVAVDRCSAALAGLGGRFHVVLLSAGEDGHVAALFPEHSSIRASDPLHLLFDDAPKPPARRASASRALLERSGAAVLLFAGESKRAALARFQLEVDTVACPAVLVRSLPECLVLTDLEPQ